MPQFYNSNAYISTPDVIAYATDPLLQDKLVETAALTADVVAGSIIDISTGSLATSATTSANAVVVLDHAESGRTWLKVARPFGVCLKKFALIAADSAATEALYPVLVAQGFMLRDAAAFEIPTT
jgi:hypothetical protein